MTSPQKSADDLAITYPGLFDTRHYATTPCQKLRRSLELVGRYYLLDVPRYWRQRRQLNLPGFDLAVIGNPLREFSPRAYHDFPLAPRYDEVLRQCYDAGVRFALPPVRLAAVVSVWWSTRKTPGDAIECGAYRGATSLLLATLGRLHDVPQRVLMLDTFRGAPEPTRFDGARAAGEFMPQEDQVAIIRQQAERLQVADRIEIGAGFFADTFAAWSERSLMLAFAHIDANLYESTREACRFCLPRMSPGGRIVFDDYNGVCDLGARLAIDESLFGYGLRPAPLAHCSAMAQVQ